MDQLRLELRLGSSGPRTLVAGPVAGPVIGVVIDPDSKQVIQTIMPNRLARQQNLTSAGESVAEGIQLTAETQVLLGHHSRFVGSKLGTVVRLWVDRESGLLTHILFSPGRSLLMGARDAHVVEVAAIARMSAKEIVLAESVQRLEDIPIYRDDATLAGDVGGAIEATLLDPRAQRLIHARVEDGHVDLSGLLEADEQLDELMGAIKRIPGVRGVRSDVIVTEHVADFAAAAIQELRDKGKLDDQDEIEVLSEHQIVYLSGVVSTPAKSAAVEGAALGANGVRLVVNNLRTIAPDKTERADPTSPSTHLR
jgi:osmotically-inducible protein OsmY